MTNPAYRRGWFQLGYRADIPHGPSSARIGDIRLLLIRSDDGSVRAFSGDCPHRGADLALGRIDGDAILCGFHGYRIALGGDADRDCPLATREFPLLAHEGLIFVSL